MLCANCGEPVTQTATIFMLAAGYSFISCLHTDTGLSECDPEAWAAVDSILDYDGGWAVWPVSA